MDARPPRERWGVAVSGGPDSVALLLLLRAHYPRHPLTLLHLNHGVRGEAAKADATFCRRLASALKIQSVIGTAPDFAADRPAATRATRKNSTLPFAPQSGRATPLRRRGAVVKVSEADLRGMRMAFIRGAARERGLSAVFLGHQLDDIAETLLMRIARGSGAGGLSAPRPISAAQRDGMPTRLRPLLTLRKADLAAALDALRIPYRTDATNRSNQYQRNRMRNEVVAAWAAASGGRDARAGAALSRELLQEDDDALEALTSSRQALGSRNTLLLRRLRGSPRAIIRRALHRWLLALPERVTLSRAAFSGLLQAVERGVPTRFSLSARCFAVIRNGNMRPESGV